MARSARTPHILHHCQLSVINLSTNIREKGREREGDRQTNRQTEQLKREREI